MQRQKVSSFSKKIWQENRGLLIFMVLMVLFRSSLADINHVPTGSMLPTIVQGDRIVINKLAYDVQLPLTNAKLFKLADPQRGDIIVFNSKAAEERLVKRVIGVPGDVIAMNQNQLFINGKPLNYNTLPQPHAYLSESSKHSYIQLSEDLLGLEHAVRLRTRPSLGSSFSPLKIPAEFYLALGDNRDHSADSRVIGLVPRDEIIGRSRHLFMSLNPERYYAPRTERFFKKL